jgi:hypothetical protein
LVLKDCRTESCLKTQRQKFRDDAHLILQWVAPLPKESSGARRRPSDRKPDRWRRKAGHHPAIDPRRATDPDAAHAAAAHFAESDFLLAGRFGHPLWSRLKGSR